MVKVVPGIPWACLQSKNGRTIGVHARMMSE